MANFYPINSPLINYFFYPAPLMQPGPNIPLANGKLFFFADEDHNQPLPTYSDVSDPNNPVVNLNPIELGNAGECALFYLENRFYYIVITDVNGDLQNPIRTISHYNPAQIPPQTQNANINIITNGQFSYPIQFWQTNEAVGQIDDEKTFIAWGWEFLQDPNTTTKNKVTFNSLANENIEGNPINEVVLESSSIQSGESTKDFRSIIGNVNFYTENQITFSLQIQNKLSGNLPVNLFFERNYGENGSETEILPITTFTATPSRTKFTFTYSVPAIDGKIIGAGNFSALRIRPALGQLCQVGITNVWGEGGAIDNPIYVQESSGDTKGKIVGEAYQIANAGLEENYSGYRYANGIIYPESDTGIIVLAPNNASQHFRERITNQPQTRNVADYSPSKIPYSRLYDVIGDTFGGDGDLIVTSNNNIVTFKSKGGARPKTAFSAQTAPVTITEVTKGLKLGVTAAVQSFDTVRLTWYDNFAPDQTPSASANGFVPAGLTGYWYGAPLTSLPNTPITNINVDPGSLSTQAITDIRFNTDNISLYETRLYNQTIPTPGSTVVSFLEFAAVNDNERGGYPNFVRAIFFSVDGKIQMESVKGDEQVIVPFLTTKSYADNLKIFVNNVANPFVENVTVNSVPMASQYFFYSSGLEDYTGYFEVDGVGIDPMIGGRTSVKFAISSTDSLATIAQKIATAANNATFDLPTDADLPSLVNDSKVSWFINL